MDDEKKNERDRRGPAADPDLPSEAELRRGRSFDLAEAIGREGADMLKGASPVAAGDRALYAIEALLEERLADPEGSLARTIASRLGDDVPLLARHYDDPAGALRTFLDRILASPGLLADLVRATDARWGRDYQERPHFDREGAPPDPEDPYPADGVRRRLERLRKDLDPDDS